MKGDKQMDVAIPIYDRFTALDAVGPYEVLSRLPDSRVTFLAKETGPYKTDNGMLSIVAEARLDDLPHPEVIMVPGGTGTRPLMDDEATLDWIRTAHETSMYTTSVCTGSLLLGAAGVLGGLEATTHWLELETLDKLGARSTSKRVVEQGKVITAAGVSSGIDMALLLASRIAGDEFAQGIQLLIEYDPQPPFDSGSKDKAPPEIVQLIETMARQHLEQLAANPS
jgi:putative intracellular protease/amidase